MSKTVLFIIVSLIGGAIYSTLNYGGLSLPRVMGSAVAMMLVGALATSIVLGFKIIFSGFNTSKFSKENFNSLLIPITIGAFVVMMIGVLGRG